MKRERRSEWGRDTSRHQTQDSAPSSQRWRWQPELKPSQRRLSAWTSCWHRWTRQRGCRVALRRWGGTASDRVPGGKHSWDPVICYMLLICYDMLYVIDMLWYVMICYDMLLICYDMLWYVMICYDMLLYVMICYYICYWYVIYSIICTVLFVC